MIATSSKVYLGTAVEIVCRTPAVVTQPHVVEARARTAELLVRPPLRLRSTLLGWPRPPHAGVLDHDMRVAGAETGTKRAELVQSFNESTADLFAYVPMKK